MKVSDYCRGVEQELTAWKAKFYDVSRKLEALPGNVREKILANMGDVNIILDEMENRIDQLRNECPTEWSPDRNKIEEAHVDMRSKYEETMKAIGEASPVSIPG